MKKCVFLFLAGFSLVFTSCELGTPVRQESEAVGATDSVPETVIKTKTGMLDEVYDKYINLKDALFNNNFNEARNASAGMLKALEAADGGDMPATEKESWNKTREGMKEQVNQISAASDIKAQRILFASLSEIMTGAVKSNGLKKTRAYIQHCPMAATSKGEGADWLDTKAAIENPYFGSKDEMKECGETKEALKFE